MPKPDNLRDRLHALNRTFAELDRSPGRFRSPLTFVDRIVLGVGALAQDRGEPGESLSLPWQSLIRFLHRSGWIESQAVHLRSPGSASDFFRAILRCRDVRGETDGVTLRSVIASGKDYVDVETALSKTVGEALERRALLLYRNRDLLEATAGDLRVRGIPFLEPSAVSAFSEKQKQRFPDRRFDDTSVFRWARGFSLSRNVPILIPAQLLFWNYRFREGEPVLMERTTNGAAGMFTREEAIAGGILEILEREAFLSAWITKQAPSRIAPETIPAGPLAQKLAKLHMQGLLAHLFCLSGTEGIPIFAAAVIDPSGKGPAVAVGGAAAASALAAAGKALSEAVSVRSGMTGLPVFSLSNDYEPFFSPLSFQERLRLWANPAMLPAFDFFARGPLKAFQEAASSDALTLPTLLSAVHKKPGREVVVYEANHPVLSKLGYSVVRVVVSGFAPFYLREEFAPLAAPAFQHAGCNTTPHPFP